MNHEEKEKLFIDIDGPKLQASRMIYALQAIENGIKFALATCNVHKARIAEITKEEAGYRIKFIWYKKPSKKDYENYNQKGINLQKKVVLEKSELNLEELNKEVEGAFPW